MVIVSRVSSRTAVAKSRASDWPTREMSARCAGVRSGAVSWTGTVLLPPPSAPSSVKAMASLLSVMVAQALPSFVPKRTA
jgi:hypothetical protein